jgi:hypothetical protein
MRTNAKRQRERARRKQLYEQLLLQAEILCESYRQEGKATVVLNRMMLIILEIIGERGLNSVKRQALADHFTDSAISKETSTIELGGTGDTNTLYLDGAFRFSDLAKRITWGEARTGQTIEVDHESVPA